MSRRARRPRPSGTCGGCERIRCVSVPTWGSPKLRKSSRLPKFSLSDAASLAPTQGFVLAKPPFRKRPHVCPEPRVLAVSPCQTPLSFVLFRLNSAHRRCAGSSLSPVAVSRFHDKTTRFVDIDRPLSIAKAKNGGRSAKLQVAKPRTLAQMARISREAGQNPPILPHHPRCRDGAVPSKHAFATPWGVIWRAGVYGVLGDVSRAK